VDVTQQDLGRQRDGEPTDDEVNEVHVDAA
jgi:hypothetical protein